MKKLLGTLLALLLVTLAAPAQAGTTRQRAGVPWDQVGDGWVLTTIVRGPTGEITARARSLELISPEGTRYSLYATRKQPLENNVDPSNFTLIGWDPDARTALLKRYVSLHRTQAIRLNLQSGASQTLALPKREMATGLRPDGNGVLSQTLGGKILSISWAGDRTLLGQTGQGGATTTPDGTAAVVAEPGHLTVLPLDGSAESEIATPGECRPLRWYDDTQLLASCYRLRRGSQLVTIGLDGTVTARASLRATSKPGFTGPSWEDTDVRVVAGRPYYEGNGPCSGSFIVRENAAGDARMVRVPGSRAGIKIVDARDDRLVIAHVSDCETGSPRAVLSTFDPVSKDEDRVLTLARSEHWGHVLAWDEPRPWGY